MGVKHDDVTISIDELVLDGFPAGDRHRIAAALSAELTRLVAERGIPAGLVERAAGVPSMAVAMGAHVGPERTGAEVARAIYGGWESPVRGDAAKGSGGGPS